MPLLSKLAARPLQTVVLLCLVVFLSGTWILPLIDEDEPRFAEASREMLQRRDFVIPYFNGQYRFDKPPLIYWCQASCYSLFGENAFAARLPSVLLATATAVLLLGWGRRLGNEKAGFYAALIFATSLQVLIHGRLAVADMAMVCFVTAANWSGWEMTRPQSDRRFLWWAFFVVSLALGFLAKGPVAWLPLAGLLLGRWRRPDGFKLPVTATLGGVLLAAALVALWAVPALLATHGDFYRVGISHNVLYRSVNVMEGHGGRGWLGGILWLPFYFLTFVLTFFPWSLKVPRAMRNWWPARRGDLAGWYLLTQAALVFVVFTLSQTKLPHYTLPAFPCISLWLGRCLAGDAKTRDDSVPKWALGMAAFCLALTLGVFTVARPYFLSAGLLRQIRPLARPEMKIAALDFNVPSLVWEFRQVMTNHVRYVSSPEEAAAFLQEERPLVLVMPTKDFSGRLSEAATNATIVRATGLDTIRFRRVDLTAVVRP